MAWQASYPLLILEKFTVGLVIPTHTFKTIYLCTGPGLDLTRISSNISDSSLTLEFLLC